MRNNQIQGESVRFGFQGALSNSNSSAISIFNNAGLARTLLSYERLIVDSVEFAGDAGGTGSSIASILFLDQAGGYSTGSITTRDILAILNGSGATQGPATTALDIAGKEGISCTIGVTPSIVCTSDSNPTGTYYFTGTGRIVVQSPQGQQSWQAAPSRGVFA